MGDTFISDGQTRKRISPATAELQRDIKETLEKLDTSNSEYDILAGPDVCTILTTSRTLHDMGIIINPDIRRITIMPYKVGAYWADGTATTSSAELPDANIEMDITFDTISTREFICSAAAVSVNMVVVQEG